VPRKRHAHAGRPSVAGAKLYLPLGAIALATFALDQITKAAIARALPVGAYREPHLVEIVPGFFYLCHIRNEGAAWGIMSGQTGLLAVLAGLALAAIFYFRESLELDRAGPQWAFGLLAGGIAGNLADRVFRAGVVDFLDVHLPFAVPLLAENGRWPAFNVADCGIAIGLAIYFALGFFPAEDAASDSEAARSGRAR